MGKKKKHQRKGTSQLATPNKSNQSANKASQLARKEVKQRQQERDIRNKKNRRQNELPKTLSESDFNAWKQQLEPMVSEANHRIEMIEHAGYTSYALDRVIQESGQNYFDLEPVTTREELIKEMTRMRVFINDKGSTLEGARLDTAQIYGAQYKGKFGNEYNNEENNFAKFDIKSIDKDVAARVFENYRKIESIRSSQIGKQDGGDGGYGSENLIIAMYDAEIRGHDSYNYGTDLLDAFVKTESDQWQQVMQNSNMLTGITGVIEDNITGRYLF